MTTWNRRKIPLRTSYGVTPLSCDGNCRRLNVFAYWQRLHRDLVNEAGRTVLYVMCCVRLCLPSRQEQIAVACMPRCRVEEWRFAASIRVYRAVFVEAALKAVTFCWQKRLSSLLHIWQTYMGRGGGFWSVSVVRPVALRQYSGLQFTVIWIHTDWSQFLCYSRVGKVRQWLQARNSPLCGTLFRS
jgi:hypothetical protein